MKADGDPLTAEELRGLGELAADLAARGHSLAWQPRKTRLNGWIECTIDGRFMIGNRTVANVRGSMRPANLAAPAPPFGTSTSTEPSRWTYIVRNVAPS